MQEWLNWHAWKACNRLKRFRGSNPLLSAKKKRATGEIPVALFHLGINSGLLVGLNNASPIHGNQSKKKSSRFATACISDVFQSGKRDSNPRPPAWKASALSTELFPQKGDWLWAVMDSNHRRLRQLSYSQPHLATLVTAHLEKERLCFVLRLQR